MTHLIITVDQINHWTGLLWLALGAVWLGSLPFVKRTLYKQPLSSGFQQTALFLVGLYLIFGTPSHPDWLNQPMLTVTVPMALAAFGISLCGIAFSIWARLTIGDNWSSSPALKQDHALILSGPYRIVRHPIYTGILFALLGSALQRGLARSFLAVVICGVGLWMKVTEEEQIMVLRFGDQYLRYRRNVSALVPFVF
jgi:protein-S-isoprenylcysteine O-methyltransferase Ste14